MKQLSLEKNKTLAERYAKALWQTSQDSNKEEQLAQELNVVCDAIINNSEIFEFFVNPIIDTKDKKDVEIVNLNDEVVEKAMRGEL